MGIEDRNYAKKKLGGGQPKGYWVSGYKSKYKNISRFPRWIVLFIVSLILAGLLL